MSTTVREMGDYTKHPDTGGGARQFTWQEQMWLGIVVLSYLLGYAIHISIMAEKFAGEDPATTRWLYLFFFLLAHVTAGLKNLQYRIRESREEEDEDTTSSWVWSVVSFPFSPLYRFWRTWQFGVDEKHNWESGIRFVDELVTMGVLRLFDVFLGDAPVLCLLLKDDVWSRSYDWQVHIQGQMDYLRCGPTCAQWQEEDRLDSWTLFRMFFLLSKMAQGITFYIVGVKRLQRLQYPSHYTHLRHSNARSGRLNIFATLLLYLAHFLFIGSRVIGYSMVSFTWGSWLYFIIGSHWLLNSAWHLVTVLNNRGMTAARSVSSLVMGLVWLFALTNEQGGRQLGRLLMYYIFAFFETATCAFLWNLQMKDTGDFFAYKASWIVLAVFLMGVLSHLVYYALCHPGSPSLSSRGLLCCSGDRRDPLPQQDDEEGSSTPV